MVFSPAPVVGEIYSSPCLSVCSLAGTSHYCSWFNPRNCADNRLKKKSIQIAATEVAVPDGAKMLELSLKLAVSGCVNSRSGHTLKSSKPVAKVAVATPL